MSAEVTLGAIVRSAGAEYVKTHRTNAGQRKVLRAIADCRTEALGGHRDQCDQCGFEHVFPNSCRDRHCPGCGGEARQRWLEARRGEVLDVPYFHVVFTIPEILRPLARCAPDLVYPMLLRAAGQALMDVGRTRLRAELGPMTVLHTWAQTLADHPHVHCVVPGGGFSLDGRRWVRVPKVDYLLSVTALSRRFRTLLGNAIKEHYRGGSLKLPARLVRDAVDLDLLLARAGRTDWHVYAKPPFGGPEQVLAYLSAYTHRIAISNRRLQAFDGKSVTFSWRDYHQNNAHRPMTLPVHEFLRRFLLHVVPKGMVRIRYYGFMCNRYRKANLEKARGLIASRREIRQRPSVPARLCPQCHKGTMRLRELVPPQRRRTWFDTS